MRNSVIKKNRKIYIFKHQQTSSGGGGGGANLENNKQVSITENGTVEITPSAGKDGMKKVTATVNVAGGGGITLYAWTSSSNNLHYFNFSSTEGINNANDFKLKHILNTSSPIIQYPTTLQYFGSMQTDGYASISDTQFKIGGGVTYERANSSYDLQILS